MNKVLIAIAALCSLPAVAQNLQARDLNGDSVADAYYDAGQDLTWLKDANFAQTSASALADATGRMSWANAKSWAAGLDIYGVTGWTLPSTIDAVSSAAFSPAPGSSQMATMFYTTLGNSDFGPINAGPFDNLQLGNYWSGTAAANQVGPDWAWRFSFETVTAGVPCLRCRQSPLPPETFAFAWAVHAGDIAPVPEPETYALMLVGLAAVGFVARRQKRRAGRDTA